MVCPSTWVELYMRRAWSQAHCGLHPRMSASGGLQNLGFRDSKETAKIRLTPNWVCSCMLPLVSNWWYPFVPSYGGKEYEKDSNCEILTGTGFEWKPAVNGNVPENAVQVRLAGWRTWPENDLRMRGCQRLGTRLSVSPTHLLLEVWEPDLRLGWTLVAMWLIFTPSLFHTFPFSNFHFYFLLFSHVHFVKPSLFTLPLCQTC